jgi:phage terminase large subunit-like protein
MALKFIPPDDDAPADPNGSPEPQPNSAHAPNSNYEHARNSNTPPSAVTLTRAERNCRWLEKFILVPDGKLVGQPLRLPDFFRDDIVAIYDNEFGPTRRAIISRGRKSGKTLECAALVLLHLCGPEARRNAQLYSAAMSRDQASLIFDHARRMIQLSPTLRDVVHVRDSAKELLCPDLGTFYKALSADSTTAMGKNPSLVIFDELGQVRGSRFSLFEALENGNRRTRGPAEHRHLDASGERSGFIVDLD